MHLMYTLNLTNSICKKVECECISERDSSGNGGQIIYFKLIDWKDQPGWIHGQKVPIKKNQAIHTMTILAIKSID